MSFSRIITLNPQVFCLLAGDAAAVTAAVAAAAVAESAAFGLVFDISSLLRSSFC